MKQLNLKQGTPEWDAHRGNTHNGSEASMMMGVHANVSRNELIHMKATATEQEFSDYVQKHVLDKGHRIEAEARPIIEGRIDDDLFPVTATTDDGYLSSSLDGMTMDNLIIWECKQWNKEKAESVFAGKVPECDYWQVVQGLAVTEAKRAIYTVSDGTNENTISCELTPTIEMFDRLLAGWKQFDKDVAEYKAKLEAGEIKSHVEAVSEPVEDLPAIHYQLNGLALTSDLNAFKAKADLLVERLSQPLKTDNDFATAETIIKILGKAEKALQEARDSVTGEIKDVDAFFKATAAYQEHLRQARLAAEKDVKAKKDKIRAQIEAGAKQSFQQHFDAANAQLEGVTLPRYQIDFSAAMKGKKKLDSLQSAVDDELAKAKIDITQMLDEIKVNLAVFNELAADHKFLFADLQDLITKPKDDLVAAIKVRIAEHEAEQARLAEESRKKAEQDAVKAADPDDGEQLPLAAEKEPEFIGMDLAKGKDETAVLTRGRPSNEELIQVIAKHYNVKPIVAAGWLKEVAEAA